MDELPAEVFLEAYAPPQRKIAERLRAIVRATMPDARERVRPGWRVIGYDVVVGSRSRFFCWIFPEREHVHLGFVNGVLMRDADAVLEGRGVTKLARWVTFRPGDRIPRETLQSLLREAADVALLPAAARAALTPR